MPLLIGSFQLSVHLTENVSKLAHRERGNSPLTTKQALTNQLLAGEHSGMLRRKQFHNLSRHARGSWSSDVALSPSILRTAGHSGLMKAHVLLPQLSGFDAAPALRTQDKLCPGKNVVQFWGGPMPIDPRLEMWKSATGRWILSGVGHLL